MKVLGILLVGVVAAVLPGMAEAGAKVSAVDYRWRNDDGGESGATWKAAANTPVAGVKRGENIRLRFTVGCFKGSPVTVERMTYRAEDGTASEEVKSGEIGKPFTITSTEWYNDGDPAAQRMPSYSGKTFVSGKCVESPGDAANVTLQSTNAYTEVEYCFQATAYARRNTTYSFTVGSGGSLAQLTIEDTDPPNPPKDFYVDNADGSVLFTPTSSGSSPFPFTSGYTNGAWLGTCKYMDFSEENTEAWFRWIPNLPETAEYNVYARWTYGPYRGRNIPYTIRHAGGTNEVFVNQRDPALAGQWNLLGTYNFEAGRTNWVQIGGNDGQACVDAVRFELVGGAPLDADGDGMLDTWETTYLGGTSATPTADADSDGMNNLQEFLGGTIPNDPSSVLAITALTGSGSTLDLKWLSATGKTYEIQKSTNLTQGFLLTEASGIQANPPTNSYPVAVGASGSGFYRVKLE